MSQIGSLKDKKDLMATAKEMAEQQKAKDTPQLEQILDKATSELKMKISKLTGVDFSEEKPTALNVLFFEIGGMQAGISRILRILQTRYEEGLDHELQNVKIYNDLYRAYLQIRETERVIFEFEQEEGNEENTTTIKVHEKLLTRAKETFFQEYKKLLDFLEKKLKTAISELSSDDLEIDTIKKKMQKNETLSEVELKIASLLSHLQTITDYKNSIKDNTDAGKLCENAKSFSEGCLGVISWALEDMQTRQSESLPSESSL